MMLIFMKLFIFMASLISRLMLLLLSPCNGVCLVYAFVLVNLGSRHSRGSLLPHITQPNIVADQVQAPH